MRTLPCYDAEHGASPERKRCYDFDIYTAQLMLDVANRSRAAFRAAAEAHFDEAQRLDLLPEHIGPHEQARARMLACVDELVDDWLHQGKLEEAGEI